MCTTFHSLREGILFDSHADGCHFCNSLSNLVKLISPSIHLLLPFRESLRDDLREIVSSSVWTFADLPHEAPFRVELRFKWGLGLILIGEVNLSAQLGVVSCNLSVLWHETCLVEMLWLNLRDVLS